MADDLPTMDPFQGAPPQAVLFDLDGTFYHLEPMRRRMRKLLVRHALFSPLKGPRAIRMIKTFREVREDLRALGDSAPDLESVQYDEAAAKCGADPAAMRAAVNEWMFERPLPLLGEVGRTGLRPILAALKGWDLPIGVFSDFPVEAKLKALGVDDMVDVVVDATEPEVNAFKPHPRGFLVGAERMGVEPEHVAYIGDRVDVDAAGAQAAGMRCLIVDRADRGDGYIGVETFEEVPNALGLGGF